MAISLYFGLPRAGKTTYLASLAFKFRYKYQNIYSNVHLDIPWVTYIDFNWLGMYDIHDGLVLIDEATVFADSRDYKNLSKRFSNFLMLHGHWRLDIAFFAQRYNGVDIKIRNLCTRLYVVKRSLIPGVTVVVPISYRLVIPSTGDRAGDIVEGYSMPHLLSRLFGSRRIVRRKYFRFFDSWERPQLPPIPAEMEKTKPPD